MTYLWAALAYIIPTFPLGYFWHLTTFKARYDALEIYRPKVIPLLGLTSMVIQGIIFAIIYVAMIMPLDAGWFTKFVIYLLLGGALSWSFSTLAPAAKSRMASINDFVIIETAFTAVQWIVVALITALLVH